MKKIILKASKAIKKNSPTILMVTGTVSILAGTVIACKNTSKAKSAILEFKNELSIIEEAKLLASENEKVKYSKLDEQQDIVGATARLVVKTVKIYALPAALILGGIVSMWAGNRILSNRLAKTSLALASTVAAYEELDKAYKNYRKNVIEKYGEDIDFRFANNLKEGKIDIIKEDGTTKTEKELYTDSGPSVYSRFFDAASHHHTKNPEYNMSFLKSIEKWANDILDIKGHLFLNEVYDALDIPRSQAGQIVGWVKDGTHDDYVSFNIHDVANRRFVNGYEYNILLDFNVDGPIIDKI